MKSFLLIHYGEIGLKNKNKEFFVKRLSQRIKERLSNEVGKDVFVKHYLGRFLVNNIKEDDSYAKVLGRIAGIKNFYYVYEGSDDVKKLANEIWSVWNKKWKGKLEDAKTFCVRLKRSQKTDYRSCDAEKELGAILLKKGINLKAKMKNPDLNIHVEVFDGHGYFGFKKNEGIGGLPANTAGKFVALISAGIDSPVAAYRMMKRGARIVFVHFDGYPYTDDAEKEHVKELVKVLNDYQSGTKLFMIPFGKLQKQIATNIKIPSKYRTILYRRFMVRIAEKIVKREEAYGLITGDNLGQVASQTAGNLLAVHNATTVPVYAPLIGYDKEEIVRIAEKIGTYEISKLPCKDTCSMFMPKSPELSAKTYDLAKFEALLNVEKIVNDSVKNAEIIRFS